MAKETYTKLIDDLDGTEGEETIPFTIEGVRYEIDLSRKNAAKFRSDVKKYRDAARIVGGKPKKKMLDTAAIRAWALENGHEVSDRGRIPGYVIEDYEAKN